jgi:hypothetical protein
MALQTKAVLQDRRPKGRFLCKTPPASDSLQGWNSLAYYHFDGISLAVITGIKQRGEMMGKPLARNSSHKRAWHAAVALFGLFGGVVLGGLATPAQAQEPTSEDRSLVMALSTVPDSLDPYYHNLAPNLVISGQLFDSLIAVDAQGEIPRRQQL